MPTQVDTCFLAGCPDGWAFLGSNCYKHVETVMSWEQAEFHCQGKGAHLASIFSAAENDFIMDLLPLDQNPWIGGNDLSSEDTWMWTDGSKFFFTNWEAGEPKRKSVNSHCVCMVANNSVNQYLGKWRNRDCTDSRRFVCKYKNQVNFQ